METNSPQATTATIYEQLEDIVLPYLRSYKEDLTKHDRAALQEYTGKFIYGYRDTGTNLLKLPVSIREYFKESFLNQLPKETHSAINKIFEELHGQIVWTTTSNKTFLYFDGLKFHSNTKEQVTDIWYNHAEDLCRQLYNLNEDSETFVKIF